MIQEAFSGTVPVPLAGGSPSAVSATVESWNIWASAKR
jgi:hypothetical protein